MPSALMFINGPVALRALALSLPGQTANPAGPAVSALSVPIESWSIVVSVAIAVTVFSLLLHYSGLRRPGILAGILAGMFAGQTVLGRVTPGVYAHFVTGGDAELSALNDLDIRHGADLTALRATGVSAQAVSELVGRQEQEESGAQARVWNAQHDFAAPRRYALGLLACLVLSASLFSFGRLRLAAGFANVLFTALWSTCLTMLIVTPLISLFLHCDMRQAMIMSTVFAVLGPIVPIIAQLRIIRDPDAPAVAGDHAGSASPSAPDASAPDEHQEIRSGGSTLPPQIDYFDTRLLAAASSLVFLAAWIFVVVAISAGQRAAGGAPAGSAAAGVSAAAAALSPAERMMVMSSDEFAAILLPGMIMGFALVALGRFRTGLWTMILRESVCGIMTALALIQCDLLSPLGMGAALIGLIIGSDARWLSASSSLMWLGRPWRLSLISGMQVTGAGKVQLAMTSCLLLGGLADERLALVGIGGALASDLLFDMRFRLLQRIWGSRESAQSGAPGHEAEHDRHDHDDNVRDRRE